MASSVSSVWAIDIGSNALKALRVAEGEDGLEIIGFDFVEHSNILTSEDVEPGERADIIADSVSKFAKRNDVEGDRVAISVAGHNSFARFIKLPPVEQKRIPEIVNFEAVQQIPFDINEVEWDWQMMENPDSDETEVGLFAIKNEIIAEIMDHFSAEGMQVGWVQIAPIALHNFANFDRSDIGTTKDKALVMLDMGVDNSTLVVSTKDTVWQRSIRIGGSTFTEAIQDKFDISFRKAEKLKRTALMSKYVRQIFSAMKPIYTDLGSEVQRSLGFYTSSGPGRDKGFSRIVAVGGGMKLKGVAKYLQQTLGIPVEKLDKVSQLKLGQGLDEAKFHENISDFMIPYGLAAQVLDDEPAIKSNLLPRKIVRAMEWARKARTFTVAASVLFLVSVLALGRVVLDTMQYSSADADRKAIKKVLSLNQKTESEYDTQTAREVVAKESIEKVIKNYKDRDIIPELAQIIYSCLPNKLNTKDPVQKKLHKDFEDDNIESIKSIPRDERQQLFITAMTIDYAPVIANAKFKAIKRSRNIRNTGGGNGGGMDFDAIQEMIMMLQGPGPNYGPGPKGKPGKKGEPEDPKEGPGFVVTIEGYSPYKNIIQMLDPFIEGEKKKGFVTRLKSIHKRKGCTFELYPNPNEDERHFKQEVGHVEYGSSDMPGGIGHVEDIERIAQKETKKKKHRQGRSRRKHGKVSTETVLIDPMTKEEMSKTYDFVTKQDIADNPEKWQKEDEGDIKIDAIKEEQMFIERDNWFRLNVKFLWKGDPEEKSDKDEVDEEKGPGKYKGHGKYKRP